MKIASFNVQKFGRSKVSDPEVVQILVEIIRRYDIIVILEVVDISGTSIETLLDALNTADVTHHYTMTLSIRLGRSSYKEQFLFLYRDDLVDLVGSYQFDDQATDGSDVFARDPYILRFRCHGTGGTSRPRAKTCASNVYVCACVSAAVLKDLVMIPVHTKPDDSETELDELFDVFEDVKKKWRTDNVMILGDFNADGAYVSDREMQEIRIRSDKNFHWLIEDDVDTTASTGNAYTYDRIVVYGDDMLRAVVPNSARAFNFQKAFDLSNEQALKVSDHYPVEVELRSLTEPPQENEGPRLNSKLLELQQENLLLEREKLNLEIQMLQMKLAKMKRGDEKERLLLQLPDHQPASRCKIQ
ncbi:deoxyribonuclease 1 like 4, tandem duplicate 1 isoform X5 [Phyllopteryx taeniolatus]|nr:deoxyribonuclease 1 like 4, tandem duplicate 1 isoform X5 [Phyllopteryx taeniolatus]XP_061641083.1 deoxyribonuclease 1 like 4, tandem duplicate 1 isoform X5 [Phyllopteryx taeniolatus]XP_061641084.1 deoxyribonuclease 1 like 4, tandem duplicate 1 isoform X5 [Phyllopteryx taeniolatus]XP_061641085.1 deoxyribonuclease 1 like 4, tandem duplicate 1 isoform X5 [Phyllopteryx taeniolatus]XP_061641086.1 deoxyribonuclease 1 like 4, tandem duplicate 1 isoform X5 [Phyllopteryx taeniolatus]